MRRLIIGSAVISAGVYIRRNWYQIMHDMDDLRRKPKGHGLTR